MPVRTAASRFAYNSCRNRHCPKCQGAAARSWLAEREADLLPVGYFHVVFTLPAEVAASPGRTRRSSRICCPRAASETMMTIRADPKHLGARIGITAVLSHMGISDDTPSAHPHDRAGRRNLARRAALDIFASGLSSAGTGAGRALPPPVPHPADRSSMRPGDLPSSAPRQVSPTTHLFLRRPRRSQEEADRRLCE